MKTLAKVCIIAAAACILPAPGTAQTERRNFGSENSRREIIFPQVNGMNVYKTDLHTHILPGMDDGAADLAESTYTAFLESYGQDLGMASYGACVDLLVARFDPRG